MDRDLFERITRPEKPGGQSPLSPTSEEDPRYASRTAHPQSWDMPLEGRISRPAPLGQVTPPLPPAIHPSFVKVAKPYMSEQAIQNCIRSLGVDPTREENTRLQGVSWIDNVRKELKLPVRTYDTAVMFFHRFRLMHPDNEYTLTDAAAAALFTACKTEDTLKKSRDIVCAAYNLKQSQGDHLSADDPYFENSSRALIGLERLMLEASGFDFRTRHPQKKMFKMTKLFHVSNELMLLAYKILLDTYRTYIPLKQTTSTMAFASLELAGRLMNQRSDEMESKTEYARWYTSREEIMETLFDLLEMYTHNRAATSIGHNFPADRFLNVRIPLNQEASENKYPRYTAWEDDVPVNSQRPHHPSMPVAASGERYQAEKGKEAAVRFMFDPAQAEEESSQVVKYFALETEEHEVEE